MKKKKILIIEDEKMLGEMYQDKFKSAGFEVFLAGSAEEALKSLPKIKPDLVLLDILLPRGNGISFLKNLNKKRRGGPILILAFSNYDDPSTKKEAIRLGAKDYLIKTNYTPEQIIKKVKSYLPEK